VKLIAAIMQPVIRDLRNTRVAACVSGRG
jgi:hypothetical protein